MPELPEVEYARRALERSLIGRSIASVRVPRSRVIRGAAPARIARFLTGLRAESIERRGKHLLVLFSEERALHLHLGMSGHLEAFAPGEPAEARHARLSLFLDDQSTIVFRDARMFGRVEIGAAAALKSEVFGALGPDPVHDALGAKKLSALLAKTKRPIKIALMDQALIAGIGNIYAAEALWRARIHPDTPACNIDRAAASRLAKAITVALRHGMRTLEEDEGAYLQDGEVDNRFLVYGREGETCRRCKKTAIAKSEHGGRSTYFCSTCQARG